jgi:excinuclease ABC subunit C
VFDKSNIQGTNPVAACVVFKMENLESDYRHFNIKTVLRGPDDFASMEEWCTEDTELLKKMSLYHN